MAGRNYDHMLFDAKDHVTRTLCDLQRQSKDADVSALASAIDNLNKAWDALTDCLIRQRDERDEQIIRLIDELAEAKKGK